VKIPSQPVVSFSRSRLIACPAKVITRRIDAAMRINFVLSLLFLSGGVQVVIEYAHRLTARRQPMALATPHGIAAPDSRPTRQRIDQQRLQLVFANGIALHKGVHVLIDAAQQLPPEKIQLTIYGDLTAFLDYAADLQRRARHTGIVFAEKIPHDQVGGVLQNSDVLALRTLLQKLIAEPAQLNRLRADLHVPYSVDEHAAVIEALYHEVRSS
jgi:hypothetical protein